MTKPARYHHGDLRAALVAAAEAALLRDGAAALSLRGVARDAGVSAMAPYHHFRDRAALLAAVAASGFGRLQADRLAAVAKAGDDPLARLVAVVRSHVAFVVANPQLYRLMNSAEFADRSAHPELQQAAAVPAASLGALVQAARAAGRLGRADAKAVTAQLWAFGHGLALLVIDGHVTGTATESLRLADSGARAMLLGYAAAL